MSRQINKALTSSPLIRLINRIRHDPALIRQIAKHFCVSGVSGLINIFGFSTLIELGAGLVVANIIIYTTNITLTFLLQKFFTYMARGSTSFQLIKFLVNAGAYFILDTCFTFIFLELLHIPPILAKICTLSILFTFNFLSQKFWVFQK